MTRREFISHTVAASALPLLAACKTNSGSEKVSKPVQDPFATDYHVHLDNSTIDQVLELSVQRGVKFGIVEHAGTKENVYPKVLSNDEELNAYIAMLEGKPVYKGVQAEWTDWMGCFLKEALAKLDFVITDAMTMPDKQGKRMKLWEAKEDLGDAQAFMDRYVDWHVEIMSREPIDIFVNVSWLPSKFAADYEMLWTHARMQKVIDAALKFGIAIEINSGFILPKISFLRMAKAAGLKFAFGTNGRYPKMGLLDYSKQMSQELGLTPSDMFVPATNGSNAVQRRKY